MTNRELIMINDTITLLTTLKMHDAIVSVDDIDTKISYLQSIHTKYLVQKQLASKKANQWNKTHKDRHNATNKRYNHRKKMAMCENMFDKEVYKTQDELPHPDVLNNLYDICFPKEVK